MQTQYSKMHAAIHPILAQSQSDVLDAPYLNAIADLADTRGGASFTPGAGVLFQSPLNKEERRGLPIPSNLPARFLDLPQDRFRSTYNASIEFRELVDKFTITHSQPGYRLVVIPISGRLNAEQLRAISIAASTFGHGTVRLTADVSIRLPNVPVALLRPLFATLRKAGLLETKEQGLAA